MTIMLSCSTVAVATQSRYGTWAAATQRLCRQIAAIIQMSVPSTIKMSTEASGKFRNPNWTCAEQVGFVLVPPGQIDLPPYHYGFVFEKRA